MNLCQSFADLEFERYLNFPIAQTSQCTTVRGPGFTPATISCPEALRLSHFTSNYVFVTVNPSPPELTYHDRYSSTTGLDLNVNAVFLGLLSWTSLVEKTCSLEEMLVVFYRIGGEWDVFKHCLGDLGYSLG